MTNGFHGRRMWVWHHNQVYGQINRAALFVRHIDRTTLSEDANTLLNRAEEFLHLAQQEAYLRRREEDDSVVFIKRERTRKTFAKLTGVEMSDGA